MGALVLVDASEKNLKNAGQKLAKTEVKSLEIRVPKTDLSRERTVEM